MSRAVVATILVASATAYVVGWCRLARRAAPLSPWRLAAAMTAHAAVATALVSPLDGLAHERFSAHMVQHLLLLLIAAPLTLAADPFPVLVWALPVRARVALQPLFARRGLGRRWLVRLTDMRVAWLLFAGIVWLWHLPALYDLALGLAPVHGLEHTTLFAVALLYWWPLLHPAPRVRGAAPPGAAVVYVVLAGFQSAALGLGLTLAPTVLYASYAPTAGALDDQAWGGILMWTVSSVVDMAVVMAVVWRFLRASESARAAPWTKTTGSVPG